MTSLQTTIPGTLILNMHIPQTMDNVKHNTNKMNMAFPQNRRMVPVMKFWGWPLN